MKWDDLNIGRKKTLLHWYLLEMQRQTTLAHDQIPLLLEAVNKNKGHDAFGRLASILQCSTHAILLAWPIKGGGDQLRGRWIRAVLGLCKDDEQRFSRTLRNAIAHFDERLDKLFLDRIADRKSSPTDNDMKPNRLYADVPRFTDRTYGNQIDTYFEIQFDQFENQSLKVMLCGQEFDITDLDYQVNDLFGRSEVAIDSNRYLTIMTETGGDIKKAEALVFG